MTFEAPIYLLALVLAAVPAGLYLSRYLKSRREMFPAAVFLYSRDMTPLRRLRGRQIGVAFLRMAIAILLALAFAGPMTGDPKIGGAYGSGERIVLVLDRSASMSAQGDSRAGTLFGDAVQLALEIVEENPAARFSVRVCPASGPARSTWLGADRARDELESLEHGFGRCRLHRNVRTTLAKLPAPAKLYVFSDLAESGPEGAALADLAREAAAVRLVPVGEPGAADRGNLSLSGVAVRGGSVTAVVENPGLLAGKVVVTVQCGDWSGEVEAELDPAQVSVVLPLPAEGSFSGTCHAFLPEDVLALDNSVAFDVRSGEKPQVLIVDGNPSGVHAGGPAYFISNAIRAAGDDYTVVRLAAPEFSYARLASAGVLVLVDPLPMPRYLEQAVRDFVTKGGRLWLLAGSNVATWKPENALLSGVQLRECVTVPEHPFRIEWIDKGAPSIAPLAALPMSQVGSWTSTRHTAASIGESGGRDVSASEFAPVVSPQTQSVLARFSDGVPAFSLLRLGSGEVAIWALAPDDTNGNFAIHPLFPVQVAATVRGLLPPMRRVSAPPECVVGARCKVAQPGEKRKLFEAATPAGSRRAIAGQSGEVHCAAPGAYHTMEGATRHLAFNCVVPASERVLVRTEPADHASPAEASQSPPPLPRKTRYGASLLAAAMVLLFLDLWLVTRRVSAER